MTEHTVARPSGDVRVQLPRVETALAQAVQTDDPLLSEMASHLIVAGGKRQRPLVALAAGACAPDFAGGDLDQRVVLGAASVELVHLGSLYHDDVIDEAEIRRRSDSVNARWGNLRAILAGDFLLARASEIAAGLSTEVAGLLAATITRLCEGEIGELRTAWSPDRTEAEYLASIGGKTASLFEAAGRIGALTSGQNEARVDALGRFGWCYGMAFQIADDILDLTSTAEELGKPAGHDLVEGVYSLPVIRALRGPDGAALRDLLGSPIEGEELDRARQLVLAGDAIDQARDEAGSWVSRATDTLTECMDQPASHTLAAIAEAVLENLD